MEMKIKAAVRARGENDLFLLARTDAIAVTGLADAIERANRYRKAGADGVYLEGASDRGQIEAIGRAFKDIPLAISVLENGGETPWLSPKEFGKLGYSMLLYPTTILFQSTYTIQQALKNLKDGKEIPKESSVDLKEFEKIVDMQYWAGIEKKYG
jgi:2-methylisocitrate lyase-like PEP mutase family enzyme